MNAKEKGLVVVCRTMPPQVVGSAVLMRNLFQPYRGKLTAIAGWEHGAKVDADYQPVCATHYLKFAPSIVQRLMQRRLNRLYFFLAKRFVYRKLKQFCPAAVFAACTPDGIFFIASFLACRKLKIPFWGHMHDLWQENTRSGSFSQKLAKEWEPVILREADRLFCMTEAQVYYYQNKYGGNYEIIPHCVSPDAEFCGPSSVTTKRPGAEIRILYTGNINHAMNRDAIGDLPACLDLLPQNYRITMLTSANRAQLAAEGLCHPRMDWGWTSVAEAGRQVRGADILLLPLYFRNCVAEEVDTVFSTKTLDYLTSNVPILVYSPATSFHSRSAKANGWGCVVDEGRPESLARGICNLAYDRSRRECIVAAAFAEAKSRDPAHWARYLEGLVQATR